MVRPSIQTLSSHLFPSFYVNILSQTNKQKQFLLLIPMSYPPSYYSAHPVEINEFDTRPQTQHVQVTHVPYGGSCGKGRLLLNSESSFCSSHSYGNLSDGCICHWCHCINYSVCEWNTWTFSIKASYFQIWIASQMSQVKQDFKQPSSEIFIIPKFSSVPSSAFTLSPYFGRRND